MPHLLPGGYFHTKNEMIAVNIVEVIELTEIGLQTDRQLDRWMDRWMDMVKPIYHPNNCTVWGKGSEWYNEKIIIDKHTFKVIVCNFATILFSGGMS